MDPSFLLQKNIKDNATEVHDFIADLHRWERDLKKDEERQLISEKQEELPPVRCRQSEETKKIITTNKKKMEETNEKKKDRISSYDYAGWDTFDVDRALASDEESTSKITPETIGTLPKEKKTTALSKEERASKLKNEGNTFYGSGRLDDAIAKYTQGMALDPSNAILPANRAMAYIKLEKYEAAEADCNRCLKLDANYIKAYLRRGSSRLKLGKTKLAAEDFGRVLELEPWNKDAKKELEKLQPGIGKQDIGAQNNLKNSEKDGAIIRELSSSKKTENKEQDKETAEKNTQKVKIEEMESANDKVKEPRKQRGKKIMITEVDSSQDQLTATAGNDFEVVAPIDKPPHLRSREPLKRIPVVDVLSGDLIPKALVSSGASGNAPKSSPYITPIEPETPVSPSKSSVSKQNHQKQARKAKEPEKTVSILEDFQKQTDIPPAPLSMPAVPRTSHQFTQDWQRLRSHKGLAVEYLKAIPPTFFCGTDLEAEIMVDLMNVLMWDEFTPEESRTYLDGLANSDGFNVNLMFLDSSQKKAIYELMEKCKGETSPSNLFEKIKASLL